MFKWMNIAISIGVSAFLAVNIYLLFSDKSVIPKSVYVDRYERMTTDDHRLDIPKEGFVAPQEIYTVYVGDDETIDTWLVQEGDQVVVGDEIVTLQTERAQGQRQIWETEEEALRQQQTVLNKTLSDLQYEREKSKSTSSSNVNRSDNASKSTEDTNVEVGLSVDVQVDVKQEGAFAQGIAAAEQELADVERQLTVVQAQLAQDGLKPALVSPVEGSVAKITKRGETLAIDIYSSQQVIVTYAINDEWQLIENGDRALIKAEGMDQPFDATVVAVSPVYAQQSEWLDAYKAVDKTSVKNPLAYYEVRLLTDANMQTTPFGNRTNAVVTVAEALDSISMKEHWIDNLHRDETTIWRLDDNGRASKSEVRVAFKTNARAVITEGLQLGDVVLYDTDLHQYTYAPKVFLPLKVSHFPSKSEWKTVGMKNYAKYLFSN